MTDAAPKLGEIERWMHAVVTHPEGVPAGVDSPEARRSIDVSVDRIGEVIASPGALSEAECLAIYSRGYRARLLECFRAEFPVLRHALGNELFDRFGLEYLEHYPPRSYTLAKLCERFADFLEETRPDRAATKSERETWPDFIVDLARLERSFNEVYRGPGLEGRVTVGSRDLTTLSRPELLTARLAAAPSLRLLRFSFPLDSYFSEVRSGGDPDLPAPDASYLAMNRTDFRVSLHKLSKLRYALLEALHGGASVAEATAIAGVDSGELQDCLTWLGECADRGFFESIRPPARS